MKLTSIILSLVLLVGCSSAALRQLIAAMNPCPCGYLGESRCHCTEDQVRRYRSKVSGPLMDRIDMMMQVPPVA